MYLIFAPREVGGISKKIQDNDGQLHELVEKETYRFLSLSHAVFLTECALEEESYTQNKQELDLEEANISLEHAYLRIEEMDVELDTAREQLKHLKEAERATGSTREGEQDEQHDHDRRPKSGHEQY